uniref:Uncharacterized protein n=1 Tax=Globisporangium ultimum (strain ATCC 200006 / CBS 805.95 / DAOM BR144) TaxID=431595 RepID=K3W8S6_GLOUD
MNLVLELEAEQTATLEEALAFIDSFIDDSSGADRNNDGQSTDLDRSRFSRVLPQTWPPLPLASAAESAIREIRRSQNSGTPSAALDLAVAEFRKLEQSEALNRKLHHALAKQAIVKKKFTDFLQKEMGKLDLDFVLDMPTPEANITRLQTNQPLPPFSDLLIDQFITKTVSTRKFIAK